MKHPRTNNPAGVLSLLLVRAGAFVILSTISACQSASQRQAVAAGEVHKVLLFTSPAPVNLDKTPGADGIKVKVYVFPRSDAKPVAIGDGVLEVLLYDGDDGGVVGDVEQEPFQVWSFPSDELALRATRSMVGIGYPLVLRWNDRGPEGRIRLIARVRDADGDVVYSRPVSVSMGAPRSERGASSEELGARN
jgi:hypothetical protein